MVGLPAQIVDEGDIVNVGSERTITETVFVLAQPGSVLVPVTVYIILVLGDAIGFAHTLQDKAVLGAQV